MWGRITHGRGSRFSLEASAIGLASALYPSADDIQHGDVTKIGEFIATFVSHPPSVIRLRLDRAHHEITMQAHLVLIASMPFMGANSLIAPDVAFDDHRLDVFVYAHLSKLDLIGQAVQPPTSRPDERIQRYRARTIAIAMDPAMPVIADGVSLDVGNEPVTLTVQPGSLAVMVGTIEATTMGRIWGIRTEFVLTILFTSCFELALEALLGAFITGGIRSRTGRPEISRSAASSSECVAVRLGVELGQLAEIGG